MTALPSRLLPRTLRGRLSLVALTAATLLIVILTVAFNTVVRRHLMRQADDELRTRAAAVATTVDTKGPRVSVHEGAHDELLDSNVWIYDGARLAEQPPNVTAASPTTRAARELATDGGRGCATTGGDGSIRLCSRRLPGPAADAMIVTALDLAPYRSSADTLLSGSLVLDAVMLACTYTLTRLAVGRALRPVGTMTEQATQWSAVTSGERFGSPDRPDELALLGASLDALLDRIRTLLRHERQLTAELSHELRTPLSRIIAELDWWQSRPRTAADTLTVHDVIARSAAAMNTICDTLLRDARENTPATPGTVRVLPALRGLTEQLGHEGHLTLTVTEEVPLVDAGVTTALLERAVSPLLANAVRYARTHVTVHVGRAPDGVRVAVTDDGPGVPPSFVEELFVPGRRADPGDGHDGAGLGLPLARRLARSAGGEVHHDAGHTPGARFVLGLPPA
ncbi:sensor histidine kinase [Streptomyces sp. NPDC058257]|uniref:sensor histidine kinase n=1 Tax=Streptomyces sp. NPDC058257 TaxID=3346409 RepID=UPI0036EAAC64